MQPTFWFIILTNISTRQGYQSSSLMPSRFCCFCRLFPASRYHCPSLFFSLPSGSFLFLQKPHGRPPFSLPPLTAPFCSLFSIYPQIVSPLLPKCCESISSPLFASPSVLGSASLPSTNPIQASAIPCWAGSVLSTGFLFFTLTSCLPVESKPIVSNSLLSCSC